MSLRPREPDTTGFPIPGLRELYDILDARQDAYEHDVRRGIQRRSRFDLLREYLAMLMTQIRIWIRRALRRLSLPDHCLLEWLLKNLREKPVS